MPGGFRRRHRIVRLSTSGLGVVGWSLQAAGLVSLPPWSVASELGGNRAAKPRAASNMTWTSRVGMAANSVSMSQEHNVSDSYYTFPARSRVRAPS